MVHSHHFKHTKQIKKQTKQKILQKKLHRCIQDLFPCCDYYTWQTQTEEEWFLSTLTSRELGSLLLDSRWVGGPSRWPWMWGELFQTQRVWKQRQEMHTLGWLSPFTPLILSMLKTYKTTSRVSTAPTLWKHPQAHPKVCLINLLGDSKSNQSDNKDKYKCWCNKVIMASTLWKKKTLHKDLWFPLDSIQ